MHPTTILGLGFVDAKINVYGKMVVRTKNSTWFIGTKIETKWLKSKEINNMYQIRMTVSCVGNLKK